MKRKMSQLVSNWTSAQGFMMSNYFMMSVNEILSFTFKTLLYTSMNLKQESRIISNIISRRHANLKVEKCIIVILSFHTILKQNCMKPNITQRNIMNILIIK